MVSGTDVARPAAGGAAGVLRAALTWLYPHPGLWLALAGLWTINMSWVLLDQRLSLAPQSLLKMSYVFAGTALALAYRHWRGPGQGRAFDALFRLLLLALFASFLTQQLNLFSHLAMSLGLPWADQRLAAWDRALGFDWNAYARLVTAHAWSRFALWAAYSLTTGPALAVILGLALWHGRHDRVDEVAFLALASGFICVGVAGLLPAVAAWNSLAEPDIRSLQGIPAQDWLEQVKALRGPDPVRLDFNRMEGVATFPSFHTCLALIIIWCSRGRWFTALPGAVAGLAIIAATPVFGGHYAADLIAGALVMAGVVPLWQLVARAPGFRGGAP